MIVSVPVTRLTLRNLYLTVTVLVLFLAEMARQAALAPILGPTPEEIQAHCQPVIDWALEEIERSGKPPARVPSEHAARLNELPYTWHLDGSWLSIGQPGALGGEWPSPLYSYTWSPELGWHWWADHEVSDAKVRRVLEDWGYYR